MRRTVLLSILALALLAAASAAAAAPPEPSLVSFSSGALLVETPQEYGGSWSAFWAFDERADSGWATPKGVVGPQTFVVALAERSLLKRLEFDTGSVDGPGRGAKDVVVEMSDTGAAEGFQVIATVSLAENEDGQSFPVTAEVPGRWLRLTVKTNHGAEDYVELMDVRAYGTQLTTTPFPDVSGTYETNYGDFHIAQQGTSVTGCYEHDQGTLTGGIEGRVMKLEWREEGQRGPAVMVFSTDGVELFGLWWYDGDEGRGSAWNGTRKSEEVGTCPHWAGGAQEQMARDLAADGRTRVYGINFDTDSDVVKAESKPTLDRIAALLAANADWSMTIEGHTDASGGGEHNRQLSRRRAESVKTYLVGRGIDAARLTAAGLGASKPVASNDTALGRAQNRRVELVR